MYRAIKIYNGGETVEFTHFNTLGKAYEWLTPSLNTQQEEKWHIRLLQSINEDIRENHLHHVTVGYNESELNERTTYIQMVKVWDDALPLF